jgi:hypothetical protein
MLTLIPDHFRTAAEDFSGLFLSSSLRSSEIEGKELSFKSKLTTIARGSRSGTKKPALEPRLRIGARARFHPILFSSRLKVWLSPQTQLTVATF